MTRPIRMALFAAVGFALPLYAFPPVSLLFVRVDLATLFAAVFIAASLPALISRRFAGGEIALALGAVAVPWLAFVPPRPAYLSIGTFIVPYLHWLLMIGFFLAALSLRPRRRTAERVARSNVWVAVAVALFGLYQAIGRPRLWPATGVRLLPMQREDFRYMLLGPHYVRPMSLFLEPSWFGGYLCWCLALAIAARAAAQSRRGRLAWTAVSAVLGGAIVATVSLGSYADLAVLGGVLILLLLRSGRFRPPHLARAGAIFLAVVIGILFLPPLHSLRQVFFDRYERLVSVPQALRSPHSDLQESSWVRWRNAELTIERFRSRPLFGIGLGQFRASFAGSEINPNLVTDPWCGWLAIAAEAGVFGPVLLLGAIGIVFRRWRLGVPETFELLAVPCLLAIAVVQQFHTASFVDLWWWYPLSLAAVLGDADLPEKDSPRTAVSSS